MPIEKEKKGEKEEYRDNLISEEVRLEDDKGETRHLIHANLLLGERGVNLLFK